VLKNKLLEDKYLI